MYDIIILINGPISLFINSIKGEKCVKNNNKCCLMMIWTKYIDGMW